MTLLADAITYRFSSVALLMLGAPLLVWLYWALTRYREATIKQFLGDRLTDALTVRRSLTNNIWRTTLLALSWLLGTIALMGPVWQRVEPAQHKEGSVSSPSALAAQTVTGQIQRMPHDVIFALDVSASMTSNDTPTGQTRLDYSKDLIADTITRLSAENIGLFLFTSDVKDLVPPTLDHLYLRMEMQKVVINAVGISGTDYRKVLGDFRAKLWPQPSDKFITLIVISDGGDTTLEGLPQDQHSDYIKVILRELGDVNVDRRKVITVGVGSIAGQKIPGIDYQGKPVWSALQVELMEKLARIGNGVYLQASDFEGPDLGEELSTHIEEGGPSSIQSADELAASRTTIPPPVHLQTWPLLLAIALLIAALVLPEVEDEPEVALPS